MQSTSLTETIGLAIALLLCVAGNVAVAETPDDAAVLSPYVNDDTFIAVRVDLAASAETTGDDGSDIFAALPFVGDDTAAVMLTLRALDQAARDIHKAGVDTLYVVAGLADVNDQGGPLFVLHVRQGAAAKDVVAKLNALKPTLGPAGQSIEVRVSGENAVLVGKPATLDRYGRLASNDRSDLLDPIDKLSNDGAVLAVVFCPGPDFRRVVRELWPQLPGPLEPLQGDLADKWRHLETGIGAQPNSRPTFALQTSDAEAAATFVELWKNLPMALEPMTELGERRHEVKRYLQPIVDAVQPRIEGTRVIVDLNATEAQLAALHNALSDVAHVMTESNRRHQRFNQFKTMGIALQNYHVVNKRLPASAEIRDKSGNPLLSWRVAILPYLDEEKLYKQFHLDEPWDSPHNRALIEKIPEVFVDPDHKLNSLSKSGRTTYQVPVAAETAFYNEEGASFRDVTDGTSKTILVVEVEPSRAVEWTKPQDWDVDVQHPLEGVARSDRSIFTAAFADAHVEAIPVNADFKKLRGLLTRDGGEVFDWP